MAVASMGTKLLVGASAIVELTSISGLELKADTIETTNYDSAGWRSYVQGLRDGGEVSVSGFFNPGDTNGQYAVYSAFGSGTQTAFTITFPATLGASWTFNGIISGFTTSADMEQTVTFEATIKVTGAPSLGLTASGGLTALTANGTSGAFSPTFANGTYSYAYSFTTTTSLTITPTAASHTINLYVDGVFNQTITSGSASSGITFAVGSKKLTFVCFESGKTQKIYDVVAIRTA
jgi:predicted secreted protein